MKEVLVRTISGAFYITLILLALLTSHIGFVSLFFILAIICLIEFGQLANSNKYLSIAIFSALFYFLSYKNFNASVLQIALVASIGINVFLLFNLFSEKKKKFTNKLTFLYLIFGFIFLTLIPFKDGVFTPKILMCIFIIIWSNDTFAYLVGKNFGNKKLMPSISPKKTIEGFAGGLVAGMLASICIAQFSSIFNLWMWLVIAVIISVFGTLGDLIQSKIKRQAGVKDSGKLMPGHGGMYDRLDSIIYASPFIYLFIEVSQYF